MHCLKSSTVHILIRGFTLSLSASLDSFFLSHYRSPWSSSTTLRSIRILDYTLFQVDRGLVSRFRVHRPRFDHRPWLVSFPSLLSFTSTCVIFFNLLLSTFSACFYNQFPHFLIRTTVPTVRSHWLPNALHTIRLDRLFLSHTRNPTLITIVWGWEFISCLSRHYWTYVSYWNLLYVGCLPSSSIGLTPVLRVTQYVSFPLSTAFANHVPIFIKTLFSSLTSLLHVHIVVAILLRDIETLLSAPLFILDGRRRRDF